MIRRALRASCLAAVIVGSLACDEPKPPPPAPSAGPLAALVSGQPSAPAGSASAPASASASPPVKVVGAALILVTWKGAELAPPKITRAKADAKKLAEEALDKIKRDNMPFEDAVKKYSDDEGTKRTGGLLGNFERGAMPDAFSDAVFAMRVGDLSGVVETGRGFYVIKRTR